MSTAHELLDLPVALAAALDALQRRGVPFLATPGATRLELDLAAALDAFAEPEITGRIERLEARERIGPHAFAAPFADRDATPVRYFLDGVQRTFPLGWSGMCTLALAVVVSGVIERRPQDGVIRAVHGLTRVDAQVIVVGPPDEARMDALCAAFAGAGLRVRRCPDEDAGFARPDDYLALRGCLRAAVSAFRAACEYETFGRWRDGTHAAAAWLVVDGRLAESGVPRALGLIKQHNRFDFTGEEMIALLALPVGQRSTAFRRVTASDHRPTTWYLRLHGAEGTDPLTGLVRVEAPAHIVATAEIDALSRAVYAERAPRAADSRWPTLLYPIHLTERILKTKLDRATHRVPATLRRYLREVA